MREIFDRIGRKVHAIDAAIADLASGQYGIVTRSQLLGIGLSSRMIQLRIDAGRLHRLYPGVYAVGHTRVCREGRWLAAVFACGERAVLSHRSAAALWGIRHYEGRIEVTAPHAHRLGRRLVARRSPIAPDEMASHRGIPVTTPERTLLDLAGVLEQQHQIDKAVRKAEFLRIADFAKVQALLERYPRKRGVSKLGAAIATAVESMAHTRSELEDRFRALVLDANLPTPLFNAPLELGRDHDDRSRRPMARARDRKAQLADYVVFRYTWTDVEIDQLRELLNARMPQRRGRPLSAAPPA
jgi:hypothetical protein